MIQKILCTIIVILTLLLTVLGYRQTPPEQPGEPDVTVTDPIDAQGTVTVAIRKINKHGNVTLDTTFAEMAQAGFEIGDIITVFAGDAAYDLPIGTAFTDVDSGSMVCRFDLEDNEVTLAINMGAFATVTGVAEKQTIEADPGYQWTVQHPEIRLQMKEKGGYLAQYNVRHLTRTDDRADYPALTDEAFANFRAVAIDKLKANTLYRSSSPLDPSIGRNTYAMAAMEAAGVRTVINLTDSAAAMQGYSTYPDSYYARCVVINPEMGYDFESEAFAEKVRLCAVCIAENDGPYLIHCKEGKDRTGILCAILECFAGASAEAVKQDYMLTYSNFYGVKPTDAAYNVILNENLVKTLCRLFGVETLENADLKAAAAQYLAAVGLTETQLSLLGEKLMGA